MYLLKLLQEQIRLYCLMRFTFHHVSIKTEKHAGISVNLKKFTFHHVSIKTIPHIAIIKADINSHSTMYLLKPGSHDGFTYGFIDSHSTMYLLKLVYMYRHISSDRKFTFHHVSIKTKCFF